MRCVSSIACIAFLMAWSADTAAPENVLWLPLGDSITLGCTGPTIADCASDRGGYRVPLALALSQPPLGIPSLLGFNVSTMGTLANGPAYLPQQWLRHEGHPGWQIDRLDKQLGEALATSAVRPDLVTLHIGTNDCNQGVGTDIMVGRIHSLLSNLFKKSPNSHVFWADVIATGNAWNTCIKDFNAQVPNITDAWAAKGMRITFVPMYESTGLCGAEGALADLCGGHQIHPTSAGYPRMASAFALSIMRSFGKAEVMQLAV